MRWKADDAETRVRIYLLIILAFSVWYYIQCMFFDNNLFRSALFFNVNDTFMDWFNCLEAFRENPYTGESGSNYPALAVLFFKVCARGVPDYMMEEGPKNLRRFQNPWVIYTLYNSILTWIFAIAVSSKLKLKSFDKNLFFLVFLLSFPVGFALERGNIINLAFVLTVFFFCFYDSENKVLREISFVALALAAGIKIYPAIFGLLLLRRKRFGECIRLTAYGLVSFAGPFFLFGGWKAFEAFIRGITFFADNRVASAKGLSGTMIASAQKGVAWSAAEKMLEPTVMPADYGYNFSFKNICKVIQEILGISLSGRTVNIMLFLLVVMLLAVAFWTKDRWKELLGYTLLMILVPSFSGGYVTLFLFIPFIEYLNERTQEEGRREDLLADSFYALVMLMIITPWALSNIPYFSSEIQPCPLGGSFLRYFLGILLLAALMLYEGLACLVADSRRARLLCGAGTLLLPAAGACYIFMKAYRM